MAQKSVTPISITQQRFNDLSDLETKYKDNALPLFGLALYIQADDLDALANESLTCFASVESGKSLRSG